MSGAVRGPRSILRTLDLAELVEIDSRPTRSYGGSPSRRRRGLAPMKLFGHPDSGHAFKVRFFLEHADIAHDYEVVDIFAPRTERQAEFRDNAPFGEVPLLLDEGRALAQSNAILLHLGTGAGRWGAEDAPTLARCREWLFWEANRIGLCLPQLRVFHRFDDHGIEDGARAWLERRYAHDVGVLEQAFGDDRTWILGGDEPSIADFSLCGYLVHADEARLTVPERVTGWLARLKALPAWRHPYDMLA